MRCLCLSFIAASLAAVLCSCGGGGISATASYNPDYGPFDRNGNYVEAWADKPAKKHWWSKATPGKPADATPTPTRAKKEPPLVASTTPRSRPPLVGPSRVTPSQPGPLSPSSRVVRPNTRPVSTPRPAPTPPPVAYTPPPPQPRPKPVSRPKPKPKPVVKAKPVVRHSVKKGDTLYSLSRRYGSSVSSIQRANGLSGTTIRLGQTLKIPK